MPVTPVIRIAVDATDFQKFYELYERYTATLEDQPEKWEAINGAMGGAADALGENAGRAKEALVIAAAQAGLISEALRDAVKQQKSLGDATHESAKGMDGLKRSVEGVGKAISFIGGWVIKLGALGGLGAIFSGLGIGDLASSALNRGRDAGRVNLSPGQLASFEVNAKRFLDVGALTNAANAQGDVTKAGYLSTLGIGAARANQMSATDLAFEELRRATEAYVRAPRGLGLNMPAVQAYLALGGNAGDIRNLAFHGVGALDEAQRNTHRDAGVLGFSQRIEDTWAKLDIAFDRAGMTIQTALINNLSELAPKIEELTGDVTHWITGILNSGEFEVWVKDAANGLQQFDTFIERVDWRKMGDDVMWLAGVLGLLKPQPFWTANPNAKPPGPGGHPSTDDDPYGLGGGAPNTSWGDSILGMGLGALWDKVTGKANQRAIAAGAIHGTGGGDVAGDLADPTKTHLETIMGLNFAARDAGGKLGIYDINSGHQDDSGDAWLGGELHSRGWAADITDLNGTSVTATSGKAFAKVKAWLLREIVGNAALNGLGLPSQYSSDKQIMDALRKRGLGEVPEQNTHIHENFGPLPARAPRAAGTAPSVKVSIVNATSARTVVQANAAAAIS